MFLAEATLKELAPPTFTSLVAQTLYFFEAAWALWEIEVSPREPAAMAKVERKFLLLIPANDCLGRSASLEEQLCVSGMVQG